jgi:hypothetical protein
MPKLIQLGSTMPQGQTPYDIFQDRMQMVNTIVQNYKRYQEKKWDAEWQQAAVMDMTQEQKTPQTDYLLNNTNPSEKDIDIEGVTQFADKAIGIMRQKEIMQGNLPQPEVTTSTMPQISQNSTQNGASVENMNKEPQKQLIPDEMEFNELLKFVTELPTGEVDWSNTLDVFNQRLEKGRALGDAATQVLNTILNQGKTDQRAELRQNVELASYLKDTMYPEEEQQEETFDPEAFLQGNPDMEITGYNSSTGGYTFKRKEEAEQKPQIDTNALVTTLEENGLKLSSASFNPTTGNLSYSFTAEKTLAGTTKASWEENLSKAQQFIKNNPDYEIKGTNPDSGSVTIEKVKPQGDSGDNGTNKTTPTYSIIQSINEDLLDPNKDYDTVLSQAGVKYDLSDPNINFATKADRAKGIYDFALAGDDKTYGIKDIDIVDNDGFVKDEGEYNLLYQEYEKGAKEYYEATGQVLPKEFLSPEEAGKFTGLTIGKGYKGGLKPVKNTENIPWDFVGKIDKSKTTAFIHDAQASGYTLADYDIEELKKAGVDIEKARKALGN